MTARAWAVAFLALGLGALTVSLLWRPPSTVTVDAAGPATSSATALRHYERGIALERDYELEAALLAYQRAIAADSGFVEAHLAYQETKQSMWRAHELPGEYRALRDSHPESAIYQFLFAHSLTWTNGNWATMAGEYGRAIALDPIFPWSYAFQYERYSFPDDESRDLVSSAYDRCSELAPELAACHAQRGRSLMLLQEPAHAAEAYEDALRLESSRRMRPGLDLDLVDALMKAGRPRAAFRSLEGTREWVTATGSVGDSFGFWERAAYEAVTWTPLPLADKSLAELERWRTEAEARVDRLVREQGPGWMEVRWLLNRAGIMARRGAESERVSLLEQALTTFEHLDAPAGQAFIHRYLCEAKRAMFELARARTHCLAAIEAFRVLPDSVELNRTLHQLLHTQEALGDLPGALASAEEYVELAFRVGSENHSVAALHDLGLVAWRMGQWEEALNALERMAALAVAKGRWLYEVGEFYEAVGAYRRALEFFGRGARDTVGNARLAWGNYGRSVLGLSRVYLRLGDHARALEHALEYDRWVRTSSMGTAVYPNLGEVYRAMGREEDAVQHASEWLRDARREGSDSFAFDARRELALSHVALGRHEEAIPHLRSLLSESSEGSGRFWDRGPEQLALAWAYLGAGRPDSALNYANQAWEHAARTRDPEQAWTAAYVLGLVREDLGHAAEALAEHRRAIEVLERTRGRVPTDELRSWFLAGRLAPYDAAIRLELEGGGAGSLERAFDLVERKKARVLLDLRTGRAHPAARAAPSALSRASLEARLTAQRRRLRQMRERSGDDGNRTETAAVEAGIDSLWNAYAEILDAMASDAPREAVAAGFGSSIPVDVLRADVLASDEALIEYTFVDGRLHAFVITRADLRVLKFESTLTEIQEAVAKLREPFQALKRGDISLAQVEWDLGAAHALHEELIAPLMPYLDGIRSLRIVPEDALWYLPFEALVSETPQSGDRDGSRTAGTRVLFAKYEDVGFLIDRYAVSYAPSARVLDPALWPRETFSGELLLLGGSGSGASAGPAYLPGAALEIETLLDLFERDSAAVEVGSTEEDLRTSGPEYRMIHFATHGLVDEAVPANSALALEPGPASDGRLRMHEIESLRLHAELVTLAACETGAGELRRGEGVLALSRAFLAAGVPSVVVGLWVIPDVQDEQGLLMPEFYRQLLGGRGKVEALWQAKRDLRTRRIRVRGGQFVSLAHPAFWAPFVLVGR